MGNIVKGKRKILNNDNETNVLVASSTLFSSIKTYVANVTNETYNNNKDKCRLVIK